MAPVTLAKPTDAREQAIAAHSVRIGIAASNSRLHYGDARRWASRLTPERRDTMRRSGTLKFSPLTCFALAEVMREHGELTADDGVCTYAELKAICTGHTA
ncbi:hypothetical protein [Streptomyces sp. SP18BB07]|uniref:hypothetical protein n=1 Tax=Streptomyces sp. SP18BB07 TaxID=3002522 RepID=UPI002E77F576|nr:hypothetical protein [Streptomyces sp. SP18BB07]MEE1764468.1 hypothetical protein [Streptomyces sp. SP18BB07]